MSSTSPRRVEIDVDAVTALVQHVADTVVTPRFRALHAEDVAEKSPGDLVTVVDLAAEAALVAGFAELTPGIPVVGEEGVSADPRLLEVVSGAEQVWVVDPIDGTQAFVDGHPDHAVMVALVERGEAVGGWICLPQHQKMYVAARGAGTWCGGERVRLDPAAAPASGDGTAATPGPGDQRAGGPASGPRGGVATHFLPDGVRQRVEGNLSLIGPGAYPGPRLWAGATYGRILSGREEFVFYWRTNPWDHAAGAVLIREAGGVSRRLDGSDYRADDAVDGLVVAASAEHAQHVVRTLAPLG